MDNIRAIRSEADYNWALAEIAHYFDSEPEPGSEEADRFDVLADLIEAYEAKHWNIEAPDPIDAIGHVMTMRSLSQSDLASVIGSKSRASEVMARKRTLTITMVHRISQAWRIPAEILVRPYHLQK